MTFHSDFRRAVLDGLSGKDKCIPCRYLYDARGSELFVEITRIDDYYPTRTEKAIFKAHAASMGDALPAGADVVELGSGTSEKTPLFLEGLNHPKSYTPVDIDQSALDQAESFINGQFESLAVSPLHADFTKPFDLPDNVSGPIVGFFPGSTIGNFDRDGAIEFLSTLRKTLGDQSSLVIGADLIKAESRLLRAYDDSGGVTRAFIKNILARINRELAGTFDLTAFRYEAVWDAGRAAVRMYLVSTKDQTVEIDGETVSFLSGERVHIEDSHKYSPDSMAKLGAQAGWRWQEDWTDAEELFSVHLLKAA